jgi:hypothetical protein
MGLRTRGKTAKRWPSCHSSNELNRNGMKDRVHAGCKRVPNGVFEGEEICPKAREWPVGQFVID